jgi:hypothetical protein
VAEQRRRAANRQGQVTDLDHALTEIYDGDYRTASARLVLSNQYGEDIRSPNYDAVTAQVTPGFPALTFSYARLQSDRTWLPDDPTGAFRPVTICPANPGCAGDACVPVALVDGSGPRPSRLAHELA